MTLPNAETNTLHDQLLTLIETSIIERYSGDLERREDPRMKRADTYVPLDTDAIRELLTELWGEHVSAQTIEHAFDSLVEDGAERWPRAYCEEDEEREREQRIDYIDHEIERIEEHLTKLKSEQDRLIGAGFDRWYAQEYHRLAD